MEKRDHGVGFGGAILGGVMGKDDAMDQDHSLTSLGLDANVRVHHGAPRKGSRNRQKFWLLGRRIHSGLACARARDRNFKKRTGFGAHPERRKDRPVAAPNEARPQPCAAFRRSSRAPESRALLLKLQKADRFRCAPGEDQTEFIDHLSKGYVRSSELTRPRGLPNYAEVI